MRWLLLRQLLWPQWKVWFYGGCLRCRLPGRLWLVQRFKGSCLQAWHMWWSLRVHLYRLCLRRLLQQIRLLVRSRDMEPVGATANCSTADRALSTVLLAVRVNLASAAVVTLPSVAQNLFVQNMPDPSLLMTRATNTKLSATSTILEVTSPAPASTPPAWASVCPPVATLTDVS